MTGYIKLDRKILEWEWYTDVNTCKLFLHMMLKANWKDGEYRGVEVPQGAFVSSYTELAQETGLSVKNIRTALKHLENTGEVAVNRQAGGNNQRKEEKENKRNNNIYACAYARKGQSTGFTNFQERDYDFDVLEDLLLQSQERSDYGN